MDFKIDPSGTGAPDDGGKFVSLENRRIQQRATGCGEILIAWHHEPDQRQSYLTLDISENGARICADCFLQEGLTGLALMHRPTGIRIDRTSMVAWCKAVRNETGHLKHYEAGIRFF